MSFSALLYSFVRFVFFFKQKTAYEMRISDWSSDVCSSDLLVARSIWAAGGRPGDIAHVAYGYGLFTGGLGAHYGAERLGCSVVPMSGGQTEKQVQLIQDFKIGRAHV